MELHDNTLNSKDDESIKTLWLLIAIGLSAFEMLLPRIPLLPWLKPGFANIITILWIVKYGVSDALLFTLLRSWTTGFFFGFSFTTFLLSVSGGLFSTLVMGFFWVITRKNNILGVLGLSMIGAFVHNITQLIVTYLFMTKNVFIFYQIPAMCGASLFFGGMIGLLAPIFSKILKSDTAVDLHIKASIFHQEKIQKSSIFISITIFLFCMLLVFVHNIKVLGILSLLITVLVQINKGSVKKLLYPFKFWGLFLFIAISYLFFSYGTRIHGIPFVTKEGAYETAAQFLRLWTWLQATFILYRFRFHQLFFMVLQKAFPSHVSTFNAGLLTLEFFPEIVKFSKNKKIKNELHFFKDPVSSMNAFINQLVEQIQSVAASEKKDII